MPTYALFLESGPKRKKTMVHVPALLGCIANGRTTEEAIAATPEAIRGYLRFLQRHGEAADPGEPFEIVIAEHLTEGDWLGNGSPYITFGPDTEPLAEVEITRLLDRFRWLREEIVAWLHGQDDASLDAPPGPKGRTARAILLHLLAVPGYMLGPALGGAPGFSGIQTQAERGALPLDVALMRVADMVEERVTATTAEERSRILQRPKEIRTLRKAVRRSLEHDWEHFVELSRRPGGPAL